MRVDAARWSSGGFQWDRCSVREGTYNYPHSRMLVCRHKDAPHIVVQVLDNR